MSTMTTGLPTFGLIRVEVAPDDGTLGGCLGQHDINVLDDMTPAALRQLGRDALRAASWLESEPQTRVALRAFGGWPGVEIDGSRTDQARPARGVTVFFRSTRKGGRTHVFNFGLGDASGQPLAVAMCGQDARGEGTFEYADGATAPFCERCARRMA